MENIFVKTLLTDKVKVKPTQLGFKIEEVLLSSLQDIYEGKCTYHGYIKPGSIKIDKYSAGYVQAFSLNGDIIYKVSYYAQVCNPSIGSIIRVKVINMNKYGILAEASVKVGNKDVPVLEVIIAKTMIKTENEINVDSISVGDVINVEILGKKYELQDKKISVIGRTIKTNDVGKVELDGGAANREESEEEEEIVVTTDEEDEDEESLASTDEENDEEKSSGGGSDSDEEESQSGSSDSEQSDSSSVFEPESDDCNDDCGNESAGFDESDEE